MKKIIFILALFFFFPNLVGAVDDTVYEIVQKRDDIMRGKSTEGRYEMFVASPRWKRTVKFKAWSSGNDKSFIEISYPKRDRGVTFLRIKINLWQYVPKIEKIIKIPPSMMLQSWMGTDFTNDDLVKESSIVDDYIHTLLNEEEQIYIIESLPKPEAAVVWGKIIQWIDKQKFIPIKDEFYDEDGTLIKHLLYDNVKKLPDRYYPTRWTMVSLTEERKGHQTIINVYDLKLNVPLEEDMFSMKALKKYSR